MADRIELGGDGIRRRYFSDKNGKKRCEKLCSANGNTCMKPIKNVERGLCSGHVSGAPRNIHKDHAIGTKYMEEGQWYYKVSDVSIRRLCHNYIDEIGKLCHAYAFNPDEGGNICEACLTGTRIIRVDEVEEGQIIVSHTGVRKRRDGDKFVKICTQKEDAEYTCNYKASVYNKCSKHARLAVENNQVDYARFKVCEKFFTPDKTVAVLRPELAKNNWCYEKNDLLADGSIKPDTVTIGSNVPVWWKCEAGHEYVQAVNARCGAFSTCGKCSFAKYSAMCIEWLDCIRKRYGIDIKDAINGGEKDITGTRWHADGYCKDLNLILELHGVYWHGQPKYVAEKGLGEFNCFGDRFEDLYNNTLAREARIRELGYNLLVIWEDEYRAKREDYLTGNFEIPEIDLLLATKGLEDIRV